MTQTNMKKTNSSKKERLLYIETAKQKGLENRLHISQNCYNIGNAQLMLSVLTKKLK